MAAKHTLEVGALEGALLQIKEYLGAKGSDFHQQFTTSMELLKVALQFLVEKETISRLAVEVGAYNDIGKHFIYKFSLGSRSERARGGDMVEKIYLKQSVLEEDE